MSEIQILEKWWSPEQVGKSLGVHPNTIREWIAEGRLPATRLSERVLRIKDSDWKAFVQRAPKVGA